ncbi:MAG TPA: hypothetical protein VK502_02080 [Candidatus Saccharimonadales bacterium]|nr:hypothetical protein [Candidatus Saccharimonadales bacterium]
MTYIPPANGGRINLTIGGNTAGAGSLVSSGTATLVGGNNITLSQNGNAITISGGAGGAAGSNTFGMSNLGNSVGTSGVISGSALRYAFAGGNNVTLSQSINGASATMTISAANQTVQTQNLHNVTLGGNTAGAMAHISSGTLSLAGGNNVTLSQNGNAVTISAGVGGGGGGIALANAETVYTSGTANLAVAGGAMTIASTTGQSFNFSVPQTSSLSATGALSIVTNGSTISIGVPLTPSATLSRFEYPEGLFTSLGAIGQGSLSINHMYVPFNVSGSAMKIGGSLSAATNTSATTASANISLWMGIYSLNGSTLSLASSGSANNGFQWSQSASTTANTSVNSMRQMTVPMNVNMSAGEYWVAAVISSATTYANVGYTMYGNNQVAGGATNAVLTPIGSGTTANRDVMFFQGIYTAGTSAGPTTINGTQINNTSVSYVQRANFYNVIFNATY